MTNQEAFDKVWDWFVVQKQPLSYDERAGVCRYRGPNGARCAIGALIPDGVYDPKIEGLDAEELVTRYGLLDLNRSFALDLQAAHDNAAETQESVDHELRRVAKRYRLTIPEQS